MARYLLTIERIHFLSSCVEVILVGKDGLTFSSWLSSTSLFLEGSKMNGQTLVLVAVTEADIRHLIADILMECVEATTATVQNGADPLLKAEQLKPDLLILELPLPGRGRLEMLESLKHCSAIWHIPVIAMSTWSKDREEALKAGCCDFLEEPFDLETFLAKVKQHLPKPLQMAC